jgi:hypothetical protein
MAKKITLSKSDRKFIDSLVENAFAQGFRDGFSLSGKQFNGVSGFLHSADLQTLSKLMTKKYMGEHKEFFDQHST